MVASKLRAKNLGLAKVEMNPFIFCINMINASVFQWLIFQVFLSKRCQLNSDFALEGVVLGRNPFFFSTFPMVLVKKYNKP